MPQKVRQIRPQQVWQRLRYPHFEMWCLLLNGFILLAQVSVTLTVSEDEARCLDQMGLTSVYACPARGCRSENKTNSGGILYIYVGRKPTTVPAVGTTYAKLGFVQTFDN